MISHLQFDCGVGLGVVSVSQLLLSEHLTVSVSSQIFERNSSNHDTAGLRCRHAQLLQLIAAAQIQACSRKLDISYDKQINVFTSASVREHEGGDAKIIIIPNSGNLHLKQNWFHSIVDRFQIGIKMLKQLSREGYFLTWHLRSGRENAEISPKFDMNNKQFSEILEF